MSLPISPIPAPGFRLISGKRSPPDNGTEYIVQFKSGWVDRNNTYAARQLNWLNTGSPWDVVAVKTVDRY